MTIELWPIDRPKPYAKNARKWSKNAIEKVAASIREFGFRQPIVCDDHDVIVIGHLRLAAAQHLKLAQVPVHVAADLSPAKIRALRLADNRVHEEAEWDEGLLGEEFLELKNLDIDSSLTGFGSDEIGAFLNDESYGLDEPPESVRENVAELEEIKSLRRKSQKNINSRNDTERYLVVVFSSRAAKEEMLKSLGMEPSERYVSANAVEMKYLGSNRVQHKVAEPREASSCG